MLYCAYIFLKALQTAHYIASLKLHVCQPEAPPTGAWMFAGLEPFVQLVRDAVRDGKLKVDPLVPIQVEPCPRAAKLATQRFLEGRQTF